MVMVYVRLIMAGKKTIDEVPDIIHDEVRAVLESMEGGN